MAGDCKAPGFTFKVNVGIGDMAETSEQFWGTGMVWTCAASIICLHKNQ